MVAIKREALVQLFQFCEGWQCDPPEIKPIEKRKNGGEKKFSHFSGGYLRC